MKNKALCFISDTNYFFQTKHAIESARYHNPDYKIILLSNGIISDLVDIHVSPQELNLNLDWWVITGRTAIIKYALTKLNFDSCILIDGDTYTYNSYHDLQNTLDNNTSLLVIPHLLKPLPNDGFDPQIKQISLMGNYNTGVFGVTKLGIDFLNWWDEQTRLFPQLIPNVGLAAEQGWLRYAADFDENVKIYRNPAYNVAYWNIKQRNVENINNNWYINKINLVIMHFSGFKKETPTNLMSIHQNRYVLADTDPVYKLYKDYKKLVWNI